MYTANHKRLRFSCYCTLVTCTLFFLDFTCTLVFELRMIKEDVEGFGSVESFLTNEITKKAASVASRIIIIVDKFI